ncbi:TrkH family potassium uptake protein [Aerococcus sp. UMB1112A]|uniref:TrkH family potassium uptake protein n=1 Tax=Aerococcus sp. UMB1112A TaxID=3050609 RepID=UPI00255010D4|nr:TrkH family potassium uptake protein [Aerococcus sp. UMB1112A]MDK8501709.1 TrkH family potassium uptake protein [Aerococcus sp. UMB1112A]
MNTRVIVHTLGRILAVCGFLMLLPVLVALFYQEGWDNVLAFLGPALFLMLAGGLMGRRKLANLAIYTKESMLVVALSWIIMSFFGGLPFIFTGSMDSLFDAFFETVSGFTTTGASVLTDVESLDHSVLFWRTFTHFIGGMGILVFVLAALPRVDRRAGKIMSAEVPGPSFGKIVPRLSFTARILYALYFVFFLVLILALVLAGMPVFDAILHAFGTAGTGGFGIKATSVAYYDSSLINYILITGMLIFGVNFNLYFLFFIQRDRRAFKNEELRNYLLIVAGATALIIWNIKDQTAGLGQALEEALFTVASVISTTGFSINDFNQWPEFSKVILLLLMFVGGCAGSTAGGLKVSRLTILWKSFLANTKRIIHPNQAVASRMEGKQVDTAWLTTVKNYFVTYVLLFVLFVLLVSPSMGDLETILSAVATAYNNVGPGLGEVGPAASFAQLSDWNKLVLSFAMLFGRLEIYPMLLLFSKHTWQKI